jgi:hypothetical protein
MNRYIKSGEMLHFTYGVNPTSHVMAIATRDIDLKYVAEYFVAFLPIHHTHDHAPLCEQRTGFIDMQGQSMIDLLNDMGAIRLVETHSIPLGDYFFNLDRLSFTNNTAQICQIPETATLTGES